MSNLPEKPEPQFSIYHFDDGEGAIHPIRVIILDGKEWWVLLDVCKALGLSNVTMVADRLKDDEVQSIDRTTLSQGEGGRGAHGSDIRLANEKGFNRCIFGSKKKKAQRNREGQLFV